MFGTVEGSFIRGVDRPSGSLQHFKQGYIDLPSGSLQHLKQGYIDL
ncbi:hypothetical protein [Siminovitchia thermophila]